MLAQQQKTQSTPTTAVAQRSSIPTEAIQTALHITNSPFTTSQRAQWDATFGSALQTGSEPLRNPESTTSAEAHTNGCSCGSCASSSSISHRHPVQRLCDQGHPHHPDGRCPYSTIDAPRRSNGGSSFRSIYTRPQNENTGLDFLSNIARNELLGIGNTYTGPTQVLHAPTTPIVSSTPHRNSSNTTTAFRRGTGDNSAREHMERFGYPTGPRQSNITHVGGYGQHGLVADNPNNVGSAFMPTNGLMIPMDNQYPPGFINLNEAEVEEDTHVMHRIHQAIAHPDAPTVPLFRQSLDGFRQFATGNEWDQRQQWSQQHLNPETLNAIHHLQLLNPGMHPTMDQIRDQEDTERTSEILTSLQYHNNNNNNNDDMDMSDDDSL